MCSITIFESKYMKINKKIFLVALALASIMTTPAKAVEGKITVSRAFYELARQNNTTKIMNLLNRGYSLESVDEQGYNPICLSVMNKDRQSYNILKRYGAQQSPECLRRIPADTYKEFFGETPVRGAKYAATNVSDTPYVIGATVLGAGAVAAAYILRGEIKSDSGGGGGGDSCKQHGTYNPSTGVCECDAGYGNHGDTKNCYADVQNCATQVKDQCTACASSYYLEDNVCYGQINNCKVQEGHICKECVAGYGTHNGDGTVCYLDIEFCEIQNKDVCSQCIPGYDTFGDIRHCYQKIEHCHDQVQTVCVYCDEGYDTYGNPDRNVCYASNPCSSYPNTVPVISSGEMECKCNEAKGYYGEKDNCQQAEEGEYQEGDGNQEEWNNLNELYCNSHGKYDTATGLCECYTGYANATNGCSECSSGYLPFDGRCYQDLNCERNPGYTQDRNSCICKEGYILYEGLCIEDKHCEKHYRQVGNSCVCKPNFDEACDQCVDGFNYDFASDECIITPETCKEDWKGQECDICPMQFQITEDSAGKHCNTCAPNRAPRADNPDCTKCAEGYVYSEIDNNCVVTECSSGVDGYIEVIIDDKVICTCDEAQGYAMGSNGKCIQKGPPLIGEKDTNINNGTITVKNNGETDELRDVYGMKPVIETGEGQQEYYDSVYNALSSVGGEEGVINISNENTGANLVYGIYSPSTLYNAASIIDTSGRSATANGTITINDINTLSHAYGMANDAEKSIYNAFAYNKSDGSRDEAINSEAIGTITITKDKDSGGKIYGMSGGGNILNAYADTDDGTAANVSALGTIDLKHSGDGTVIGIEGKGTSKKINNALSFLNSAVSDAISQGNITVEGNGDVYGIFGAGTIVNSETQFNKSYPKIYDFRSKGVINAKTHSDKNNVYGMFLYVNEEIKADLYNALGYNSEGEVIVENDKGGSAVGLWHGVKLYIDPEDLDPEGHPKEYYNNTYNAFRSSAKYGDSDVYSKGDITVNISGNSNDIQNAIGIHAAGNVFNAYANSGGSVELQSQGNITINDRSSTTGMTLKGIESGGATIANAYAEGKNENTLTNVEGNININMSGSKAGGSSGFVAGMYTDEALKMTAKVLNAALVNDKSNVNGKISISSTSAPYNIIYGIYASRIPNTGEPGVEGHEKTVYNAYYENSPEVTGGSVNGLIEIKTERPSFGNAEYYGIYVSEGVAHNAYSSTPNANVKGTIDIDISGGENNGMAVGMYGYKSKLYNSGVNSIINVTTHRTNTRSYGLMGKGDSTYLANTGIINSTSEKSDAYGMYINEGIAVNGAGGILNVQGKTGSYGIYAIAKDKEGEELGTAQVQNFGTINVGGATRNIGILADGSNVTVKNSGTININGTPSEVVCRDASCNNAAIMLLNGAEFFNGGSVTSTGSIDLDAMGENIYLTSGGNFSAENELSGNLRVATSTVKDTFGDEVVLNNALSAQNIDGLNVSSQSYMYNTNVVANDNGSYDIVMQLKDFLEIADDSEASYLRQNYNSQKNIALFNALRSASNATQAQIDEANIMGKSMLPNITEEELKVQRGLDKKMVNELFKDSDDDVRKMVGADAMRVGRGDHGTLTGYDINSQSMYSLYDKRLDNRYRLGLGLSFTHTYTDYNNDSTRKNFMVQGYVPLTYNVGNGITAVSMARVGYADGEYKRIGYNDQSHKADTSAITYGLLNEVRYTHDMGFAKLTPFVGLNAIGWHQDSVNEGNDDLALRMDAENVFSLESALGIYVDKAIEFNQDNVLNIALGLGYYHEFADPYRGIDAHHNGSLSNFRVKNRLHSRDRGILSAKAEYDYKAFSLYGELMQYLEEEHPIEVEGGIKYRF